MIKRAAFVLFLAGIVVAFEGCQSAKGGSSISLGRADDPVSLVVLSARDVRSPSYGTTFLDNPFIAATGTLLPSYNDYIVLQLNFNNPKSVPIVILRADVEDDRGKVLASYMTKEKFTDFAMTQSPDQANNTLKRNRIDWYYLPNPIMTVDAGKHSYLLVLVGPHPIPDTATIHVAIAVENVATAFDEPVPVEN